MKKPVNILMVGPESDMEGEVNSFIASFMKQDFLGELEVTYIPTRQNVHGTSDRLVYFQSLVKILIHFIYKNPQIIHIHMADKKSLMRKYVIYKISRAFRKKVVLHNYVPDFKKTYLAASLQTKTRLIEMLQDAERVVSVDNSWRKLVNDVTLDTSVDKELAELKFKKRTTVVTEFNILFFHAVIERNGILDLIEASLPVIQEAAKQNKHINFQIAGDGMLLELSKELVSAHNLDEFYHFHGPVTKEKKKELLKRADLFVMASHYEEHLPKSVLEALSYGIPVISTDVGTVSKVIRHGGNGFLINPGEVHALANCLHVSINIPFYTGWGKAMQKISEDKMC
jgi:glycosyltransferase involved in cell wall biosynthesis